MVTRTVRTDAERTVDVEAKEVRGVDPGKVESIEALIGEADRLDAPPAGEGASAGPAAPPSPPVDPEKAEGVADLVNLLEVARDASSPMLVDLGVFREGQVQTIWTGDALKAIAVPLVQVCNRHDVGLGEVLEKFGPYVGLFLGVAMPTLATMKVLRENKASVPDGGK